MPYYRKLTAEEQAEINKCAQKCWIIVFGIVAVFIMSVVVLWQIIH